MVRRLTCERDGSSVVTAALIAPVLVLTCVSAIDFSLALRQKSWLQSTTDSVAIAAAKELSLSVTDHGDIPAIVETIFKNMLTESGSNFDMPTLKTAVNLEPLEVSITAVQTVTASLSGLSFLGIEDVGAHAVARVVGKPNICVLGLSTKGAGAIALERDAHVTGNDCAVFSNSTSPMGIKSRDGAVLKAQLICSAGGRVGGKGNFEPAPVVDCPQFEDPLASRPAPRVRSCLHENLVVTDMTTTLRPGTYCGGITINGTSRVTFERGVYVISDGDFIVEDSAEVGGINVGFYLAGSKSVFTFGTDTTISLSAPKAGPMAGVLIFGARGQKGMPKNTIMSNNARVLLGTIYLPSGRLHIDGTSPIAGESAYTAIVAQRLTAGSSPKLVLNTDYHKTDIPVPSGIKGAGQPVALVE